MLTIPSQLVDNCDCDLDATGKCRCPIGIVGPDCDKCGNEFWNFGKNNDLSCKSKFFATKYQFGKAMINTYGIF